MVTRFVQEIDLSSVLELLLRLIEMMAGVILLSIGGNLVVDSSVKIARKIKLSELVIGIVLAGFGSSSPELFVSVIAAIQKMAELSIGNVVGSNVYNLCFILGLCACISSIPVQHAINRRDSPMVMLSTLLLLLVLIDGMLKRWEAIIFLGVFGIYILYLLTRKFVADEVQAQEIITATRRIVTDRRSMFGLVILLCILGFLALFSGAHLLIDSASAIAAALGVSQWVIGITIVAAGTSLPETAISVIAVIKKKYAVSIGNLVGSCTFNILCILGVAGVLMPLSLPSGSIKGLIGFAIATAIVLLFMAVRSRLSVLDGIFFIAICIGWWCLNFFL